MPKYEYMILERYDFTGIADTERTLDEYGQDGWRLVCATKKELFLELESPIVVQQTVKIEAEPETVDLLDFLKKSSPPIYKLYSGLFKE